MKMSIRRGDIYYYDFGENTGSVQAGRRPVLILQTNLLNERAPTVTVAPITTAIKNQYFPSHVILPNGTGLTEESMVLLEQVRTISKSELLNHIGRLKDSLTWERINRGIKITLGARRSEGRTGDIRCLCPRCLRDYMSNSDYIVRRLDPFHSIKEPCDKCNGMGYDYIVYDRNCFR